MTPIEPRRVRTRAATTLLLSATVGIGLHRLPGAGAPTPPLGDIGALHGWIEQHGTVIAAMSAVRLVAITLAAYIAVVAAASLVASSAALPRSIDRAVRRITPRALRSALGLGVLGAVALPIATPPAAATAPDAPVLVALTEETAPPPEAPPVLEWVGGEPPATTPSSTAPSGPAPTTATAPSAAPSSTAPPSPSPTTTAAPSSTAPPSTSPAHAAPSTATTRAPATPSPAPADHSPSDQVATGPSRAAPTSAPSWASEERTWQVRPGDHFWAIADAVVREHAPEATEAEVARYWRTLIDANRDRLVVPGNADLVLPGQVLTVPAMR